MAWRTILRGVAIVYGTTFVSGLVFAFNGITPQTDHIGFPLLALLTGAVGVAIALRVAETTKLSYLLAIGVGVWLLNLTSVLLDAQSLSSWVSSSGFIATTVILGRLLIGVSLEAVPTPTMSYSLISRKSYSGLRKRRTRFSRF
ncbi:MAG: hypothetical protein HOP00_00900 [Nitrospira sp.]|nr:hypothetical protein [Nitrospira sp.]